MDEKMRTVLLGWCERHATILSPVVVAALKDLVETVVKTTDTPLDDAIVLPLTGTVFKSLDSWLLEQADKIDGVEGNCGAHV